MPIETKVLSQKILHTGFTQLYEYELQPPSLNSVREYAAVINREILHTQNAVMVLIFAPDIDSFVLCQEFRTGVFFNTDNDDPFIFECAAGIIDPDHTPETSARKEVMEETGLIIDRLVPIAAVYSSPGRITEKTHIFCAEIKGSPQTGLFGVAEEGEEIKTHIIKRAEVFRMMDNMKIMDSMSLLALNWFRANHPN